MSIAIWGYFRNELFLFLTYPKAFLTIPKVLIQIRNHYDWKIHKTKTHVFNRPLSYKKPLTMKKNVSAKTLFVMMSTKHWIFPIISRKLWVKVIHEIFPSFSTRTVLTSLALCWRCYFGNTQDRSGMFPDQKTIDFLSDANVRRRTKIHLLH